MLEENTSLKVYNSALNNLIVTLLSRITENVMQIIAHYLTS